MYLKNGIEKAVTDVVGKLKANSIKVKGRLEMARVARFPHAGDLILLGAWDGKRVICFEEQVASHGGLGGPQGWPFLAYPPGQGLGARGIENSEEVYTRLVRIYGDYE